MRRSTRPFLISILALSFWSSGVFLIRFMSDWQLWTGWPEVVLFVISPVLAAICIVAVQRLLSLPPTDVLPTVCLLTGVVVLLHAMALSVVPELYGSAAFLFPAARWLVWFCGSVLLPAVILYRPRS